KAVSMCGPFIFMAVVAPLICRRRMIALGSAIFVALHLGFGLQRIVASGRGDGLRATADYPGVPELKTLYNWDLGHWNAQLRGCQLVNVAITSGHIEPLLETFLLDSNIPFGVSTPHPLRNGDLIAGAP